MDIDPAAVATAEAAFSDGIQIGILIATQVPSPAPPQVFVLFIGPGGLHVGSITVRASDLPFTAIAAFTDAKGNPTRDLDGAIPIWDNSDAAIVGDVISADQLSVELTPESVGVAILSVNLARNDGSTISGSGVVTVEPGPAAAVDVTFQS